ncbi:uncharacterized protein LOC132940611 [Metopolophium dirhodum]|uniref:uncharacterized protein LOC132940611 n=1 Tax=Metopolophium dirhodum TaxID=44670 RepID=UPI00298FD083|nr:uncharacterized protein LOC132940611 [Metopolophium dirhodum]
MFATKTIHGLMIVAVLLISTCQGIDQLLCQRPNTTKECYASETYVDGWINTGWYYESNLKVCLPFYTRDGWHFCTQNYNVPTTREACEFLCAQECKMIYNGATGVCMHREICQITYHDIKYYYAPSSCGNRLLNCCPLISDKRLHQYSDPKKDPDGILISARLKNNRPSDAQPVYYSYYLPIVHLDGKLYK